MGATHFLPRLVGPQAAAKLMLTSDTINGEEAARIGLVESCHSTPEDAVSKALDIASTIASQAPLAVRTCVRSLRLGGDDGLERALWREADAQAQVW